MGLPLRIAQVLPALEFEARKDAAQMVGAVLRLDNGGDCPGTQYMLAHPQLLTVLFEGYSFCANLPPAHACMHEYLVKAQPEHWTARRLLGNHLALARGSLRVFPDLGNVASAACLLPGLALMHRRGLLAGMTTRRSHSTAAACCGTAYAASASRSRFCVPLAALQPFFTPFLASQWFDRVSVAAGWRSRATSFSGS